jgi:hypothetical protein
MQINNNITDLQLFYFWLLNLAGCANFSLYNLLTNLHVGYYDDTKLEKKIYERKITIFNNYSPKWR